MIATSNYSLLFEDVAKSCGIPSDIPHFNQVINPVPPKALSQKGSGDENAAVSGSVVSLTQEIAYLKATSCVSAHRPIVSHRKKLGVIIIFVKKIIRKLTKFYVEPITLDQSDRNMHMARTFELMQAEIEQQKTEITKLRQMIEE